MKIKDLDRNEVYGLEEIKKDSVKFDMLTNYLQKQDGRQWDGIMQNLSTDNAALYYNVHYKLWILSTKIEPTKCALTLFDLDITEYQVDCSDLSSEQIEEMGSILLSKGKDYLFSKKFALSRNHNSDFLISRDKVFYITNNQQKTTITYDKFMELFGEKKPIEQAVKELADAFEQKPSQYQIGIDTFTRAEANMTREEILACARFNLDKYVWRKKGQDKEDFEKIIAYANWALKNL